MRSLLLLVLLGAPACFIDDDDDLGPQSTTECQAANLCTSVERPFRFGPVTNHRFGVGTEVRIEFAAHSSLEDLEIVASDPSVLEVEVGFLDVRIRAHKPGSTAVLARHRGATQTLDLVDLTAIAIDTIGFTFRTAPVSAPVASIAGIVGRTDSIGVSYRSVDGEELRGGSGTFEIRGSGIKVVSFDGPLSEVFEPRLRVGVELVEIGTAELVAKLDTGREQVLPIEVIAEPTTLETFAVVLRNGVIVAPPEGVVTVDEPIGVDVVGRTADGRIVAGVIAEWSTSGAPVAVLNGVPASSELVFQIQSPGTVDITATVGAQTVTQRLDAR